MIPSPTILIFAVMWAALSFGAGWKVNGWRHDAAQLATANEAARVYNADRTRLVDANDKLTVALATSEGTQLAQLRKAQNETNRLRNCLLDNSCGLRVSVVRPVCAPSAATGGPNPPVDSGASAELDSSTRRAYFALRDGIDQTVTQLGACQEQLRLRQGIETNVVQH